MAYTLKNPRNYPVMVGSGKAAFAVAAGGSTHVETVPKDIPAELVVVKDAPIKRTPVKEAKANSGGK